MNFICIYGQDVGICIGTYVWPFKIFDSAPTGENRKYITQVNERKEEINQAKNNCIRGNLPL